MSAIGTDLLWLRFYLFAAYVFLFAAALTNFPPWGTWNRVSPDLWLLGAILWPFFVGKDAQAILKAMAPVSIAYYCSMAASWHAKGSNASKLASTTTKHTGI